MANQRRERVTKFLLAALGVLLVLTATGFILPRLLGGYLLFRTIVGYPTTFAEVKEKTGLRFPAGSELVGGRIWAWTDWDLKAHVRVPAPGVEEFLGQMRRRTAEDYQVDWSVDGSELSWWDPSERACDVYVLDDLSDASYRPGIVQVAVSPHTDGGISAYLYACSI